MEEEHRYRTVDLPFYEQEIAPFLPPVVLDFHAHTWRRQDWRAVPWEANEPGASYMVAEENYPVEALRADGRRIFPGRGRSRWRLRRRAVRPGCGISGCVMSFSRTACACCGPSTAVRRIEAGWDT